MLVITTIMVLLGLLGTDLHLPALPQMALEMHTSQAMMQSSISLFLLGVGLSALVWGPLSDKYGRKPIVLAGLFIALLANLWAFTLSEIEPFLASRFVQGIGSGVCLSLSRVVLSDIVQGERYAITSAYVTLFTALSVVLGPFIGGFIQTAWGWRANFLLMALIFVLMLALYAWQFPETNRYRNRNIGLKETLSNYVFVMKNPRFVSGALLVGISMGCFVMYTSTSPFILQRQLGMSAQDFGMMSGFVGTGLLLSRMMFPHLVKRHGMPRMMVSGLLILIVCGLLLLSLWAFDGLHTGSFLASVSGVFFAYTFVGLCGSAVAMEPFTDKRGAAGAIFGFFQMSLVFLINAVASALPGSGLLLLGTSYLILPMAGLLLCRTIFAAKSVSTPTS
ncbi:MAG: multidrug effflux MFS transporter [Lautropia sp.]|nr:multidrug effflux MFS transporter [Lautropia sp.]